MKERPILFSAPMVLAILVGTKTQTRRIVKMPASWDCFVCADWGTGWWPYKSDDGENPSYDNNEIPLNCPYGLAGDRIWVRETYYAYGRWETRFSAKKGRDEWHFIDMTVERDRLYQHSPELIKDCLAGRRNGGVTPTWWKRPAIFMPRAACRIELEVTGVRVERLQDVSDNDAIAEGIAPNWIGNLAVGPNGFGGQGWVPECGWEHYTNSIDSDPAYTPVESYRSLWESINGPGSWDANPWVWCISFRRINA